MSLHSEREREEAALSTKAARVKLLLAQLESIEERATCASHMIRGVRVGVFHGSDVVASTMRTAVEMLRDAESSLKECVSAYEALAKSHAVNP